MTRFTKIALTCLLLAAVIGLTGYLAIRDGDEVQAELADANISQVDLAGFARADAPQPLTFPEDFGPHPDYLTEWWYYTGNLTTERGRHFGYQLTFFRRALAPPNQRSVRRSDWAADQIYLAHFALTDVEGREFQSFERLTRGAAGLAGARAAPYQVWLEDWVVEQVQPAEYRLRAKQDNLAIDLLLTDQKGPIVQGDRGYSQKGPEPGNASYYYSQTRLESTGVISLQGREHTVRGWSWMDHEFSTSALSDDQVGWDWFGLQLADGSELMVFHIRKADGSIDAFSSGMYVGSAGDSRVLAREDFEIEVLDYWQSPRSGATYPAAWRIGVPALDLDLRLEPYLSDQELNTFFVYWEGAVQIMGQQAGKPVEGSGYVEMTGYQGSMAGQF